MSKWLRSVGLVLALAACFTQVTHAGQHGVLASESSHCSICHTATHTPAASSASFQPLHRVITDVAVVLPLQIERVARFVDSPRGPPAA